MLFDIGKKLLVPVAGAAALLGSIIGYDTLAVDSYGGLTYDEAYQIKNVGEPERGIPPQDLYIQALSALPPEGLVKPNDREQSLVNADNAGLLTAGYILVGCGDTDRNGQINADDGRTDVDFAREGLSQAVWDRLTFAAIDVEISCQNIDRMYVALDRLEELGKPRVIYTSYNWWVNMKGNPQRKEGTILWNAYWDDDCTDLDFERRPYGGFQIGVDLLGEQCQGGTFPAGCHTCNLTTVAGQNVDLNVLNLDILPGQPILPVLKPPPDYSPECWSYHIDSTWKGHYNSCGRVWVGPQGHYVDPGANFKWYYPNGVPMD